MANTADIFRENVERYFEGPDPRTRGIGTIVGGVPHTNFRDYKGFQVYDYPDSGGVRVGRSVKGEFKGVGQEIDRNISLILFTRSNDVQIRSWSYFKLDSMEGIGFENDLEPAQEEAAVEYSANPIVFSEVSLFMGISGEQEKLLSEARARVAESNSRLQAELKRIRDAERQAAIDSHTIFLR